MITVARPPEALPAATYHAFFHGEASHYVANAQLEDEQWVVRILTSMADEAFEHRWRVLVTVPTALDAVLALMTCEGFLPQEAQP